MSLSDLINFIDNSNNADWRSLQKQDGVEFYFMKSYLACSIINGVFTLMQQQNDNEDNKEKIKEAIRCAFLRKLISVDKEYYTAKWERLENEDQEVYANIERAEGLSAKDVYVDLNLPDRLKLFERLQYVFLGGSAAPVDNFVVINYAKFIQVLRKKEPVAHLGKRDRGSEFEQEIPSSKMPRKSRKSRMLRKLQKLRKPQLNSGKEKSEFDDDGNKNRFFDGSGQTKGSGGVENLNLLVDNPSGSTSASI